MAVKKNKNTDYTQNNKYHTEVETEDSTEIFSH